MLYQLHDLHHAACMPLRLIAGAAQTAFQNPYVPAAYTGLGRSIAASAELIERTTRRYAKPEWGLSSTRIAGEAVPVETVTVAERPFCKLIRFVREGRHQHPRVLVVAPMSGHHATLLRGTVEALLPDHDVHVTDWIDARQVPLTAGSFGLDTYIDYVIDFLRLLGPDLHVLAVCQPAVPVLAAVSLLAQMDDRCQPRSMVLMGGPIDTGAAPTVVTRLAERRPLSWFERTVIAPVPFYYPGGLRRVYPGFIQLTGFMSMNLDRHVGEHLRLFEHLVRGDGESARQHCRFYDEYLSVMDLPAEFYLETVSAVFQERALPRGRLHWRGHQVDPAAIARTALMTVEGELDDISAPGQTRAAHRLCSGLRPEQRLHHLQEAVGHYGIFNGRRFRERILPRVRAFIRAQAGDSGDGAAAGAEAA